MCSALCRHHRRRLISDRAGGRRRAEVAAAACAHPARCAAATSARGTPACRMTYSASLDRCVCLRACVCMCAHACVCSWRVGAADGPSVAGAQCGWGRRAAWARCGAAQGVDLTNFTADQLSSGEVSREEGVAQRVAQRVSSLGGAICAYETGVLQPVANSCSVAASVLSTTAPCRAGTPIARGHHGAQARSFEGGE